MAQDPIRMTADKALEADIMKCTTPEEIRQLLSNAVERSDLGVTRDVVTGQYVKREVTPEAKAAADAAAAEKAKEITKIVNINGKSLEFNGTPEDVEISVAHAKQVAALLKNDDTDTETESAEERAARVAIERVDLELKFRRGEVSAEDYLTGTGAVENYLAKRGFDVDAAANAQQQTDWATASDTFRNSTAGDTWPGGERNMYLIGLEIQALGLTNATDKVAALTAGYESMKKKGIIFTEHVEMTQQQLEEFTSKMTPQEILEHWKSSVDSGKDAEAANHAFIEQNRRGGSGIFGK